MPKRILIIGAIAAAGALVPAGLASADEHVSPPCAGGERPGAANYAHHHILPATPGHKPGAHRGYSLCLGVH